MRAYRRLRVCLPKRHRDKLDGLLSGGIQPVRVVLRALAQLPHSERLPSAVLSFLLMQVFCFQSRDADEIEDSA